MKAKRALPILSLFILCSFPSIAAGSEWATVIGGSGSETAFAVRQTGDGGYIVAGATASFGAGNSDGWVLKIDQNGTVLWQKTFGGSGHDAARAIEETADGGYIVAGETDSSGTGGGEAWVLKVDRNGTVLWQKTYGDYGNENARSIQQTADGGYIVAGAAASFVGGDFDAWVLKLDHDGTVLWQQVYGGSGYEAADTVRQTADGGYIVAGGTNSSGAGACDGLVLKLDPSGTVLWQKTYGSSGNDLAYSIQPTADGGYIVAGETGAPVGGVDAWVLKLDRNGTVLWQKRYASSVARSIGQTSEGGYIIAGEWGGMNAGVLKLDAVGNVMWRKSYGSPMDVAYSVQQTSDRGYIVAGSTRTLNGSDCFLLKIAESGQFAGCAAIGTSPAVAASASFSERPSAITVLPTGITPRPAKIVGVSSAATQRTVCRQSGPRISVSPSTYEFCTMSVGSRQKERFTIANSGSDDLEVSKWGRSGDGSDIFIVGAGENNPCPDHPFTMGSGKSCTLMAIFNPTSSGPRSALLTIESNDPEQPLLAVSLEGTGIAGNPDLAIFLAAEAPLSCRGETITASSIVANIPIPSANASYPSAPTKVRFYLSASDTLQPDAIFLGERPVPCLDGDATDRAFDALALPQEMGSGTFYLLSVVDPDNAIREAKENNNIFALPLHCP